MMNFFILREEYRKLMINLIDFENKEPLETNRDEDFWFLTCHIDRSHAIERYAQRGIIFSLKILKV